MKRIIREEYPIPEPLKPGSVALQTEMNNAKAHYREGKEGNYKFSLYRNRKVKQVLHNMFNGKCAYCESRYDTNQPGDVEHFRPKGGIHGQPKGARGYWWLAADWENLLMSCIFCNRVNTHINIRLVADDAGGEGETDTSEDLDLFGDVAGKGKHFPLGEEANRADQTLQNITAEKPLLINPCEQEPRDFLWYDFHNITPRQGQFILPTIDENGELSKEGSESIKIYGLNRLQLRRARARVIYELTLMIEAIEKLELAIEKQNGLSRNARIRDETKEALESQIEYLWELIGLKISDQAEYTQMAKSFINEVVDAGSISEFLVGIKMLN